MAGEYRVAPTVVRDAYRLDRFAATQPFSLRILHSGERSADAYRLTPRELLELGKWHFARDEFSESAGLLERLVENWNLRSRPSTEGCCEVARLDELLRVVLVSI